MSTADLSLSGFLPRGARNSHGLIPNRNGHGAVELGGRWDGDVRHSPASMLRAGLIGLPSAGKTTLFRLLTDSAGGARPPGRQDASVGVAQVPDSRLDRLAEIFEPRKRTSATVTFADMAARGGGGAGALVDVAPYRTADALLHVVRAFENDAAPHPAGSVDPGRDARTLEDEIILADLGVAERRIDRLEKDRRKGALKGGAIEIDVLRRCASALEDGMPLRALDLDADAARRLRGFQFLSAKPLLLVLNVDEADATLSTAEAVRAAELDDYLGGPGVRALTVCARIELEIAELEPEDAAAFLADLGLREAGLDRVIRAAYDLLGYVSFFTTGSDECRAWSIPSGTVAHDAAGEIHSDMARGFVRAEVVDYDRLVARGSLAACRRHAEVRVEGRDYVVRDGDVINVRFAT